MTAANARRGPPQLVRAATARFFGSLAAARRARSLHPHGVAYAAELVLDRPPEGTAEGRPSAALFAAGPSHHALVRFSRGAGLPQPLPDVLGLAVKLPAVYGPGRDQDLLLATSGRGPLTRHLLLPARSFWARPFSSVLLYSVGGEPAVVGAVPAAAPVRAAEPTDLADLCATADAGELRYGLTIAPALGRSRPVAELRIGARLGEEEAAALRFDPSNTGEGLELTGPFNGLRVPAYSASRRGWPHG